MKIIDPHLHLFNVEQGDYHWLKAEKPPFWHDKSLINRTYTEGDLALSPPLELVGFVHIEAGFDNNQPWRELVALEQSCNKPFRAIANIDLTVSSQYFEKKIEKLAKLHSFVGARHSLDEQALSLLTNKQVLSNFKKLNDFCNKVNKIKQVNQGLIFETQLPLTEDTSVNALCKVMSINPDISFIINHAGFPPADTQTIEWQRWQNNLLKLSMFPHVTIKCSGWEMTNRNYQPDWLNKNLAVVLKIFGDKKMMLASNFPLCLFSKTSYQDYWQSIFTSGFFQTLTEQEKNALCYGNALKYYHLKS